MSDKAERDRKIILQGSRAETADVAALQEYLDTTLPEIAPSPEEKVIWLTQGLVRARREYQEACRLAWELYLAGTGQTESTFRRVSTLGPVQDVKVALLDAALRPGPETGTVSDDNAPTEETP